jgi:hypothetical protein
MGRMWGGRQIEEEEGAGAGQRSEHAALRKGREGGYGGAIGEQERKGRIGVFLGGEGRSLVSQKSMSWGTEQHGEQHEKQSLTAAGSIGGDRDHLVQCRAGRETHPDGALVSGGGVKGFRGD